MSQRHLPRRKKSIWNQTPSSSLEEERASDDVQSTAAIIVFVSLLHGPICHNKSLTTFAPALRPSLRPSQPVSLIFQSAFSIEGLSSTTSAGMLICCTNG